MLGVFTALGLVTLCGACGASGFISRTVADVTRPETLVFKASRSGVYAAVVKASGSIDGRAEVQLILNGAVYRRQSVTGTFEVEVSSDWYSPEAEVRYVPEDVKSGGVAVKVRFRTT